MARTALQSGSGKGMAELNASIASWKCLLRNLRAWRWEVLRLVATDMIQSAVVSIARFVCLVCAQIGC